MDYVKKNISGSVNKYFKQTLISVCFGFVATIICVLFFSIIVSRVDVPTFVGDIFTIISVSVGGLIAGYFNGKAFRQNGIGVGLVCGIAMVIILFFIKAIFFNPVPSFLTIIKFLSIIFFSIIGGIMGVNKKTKRIKY